MDVEKVKAALMLDVIRFESFAFYAESVGNISERDRAIACMKDTKEALAELEKPVEEEIRDLAATLEGWNRSGWSFEHIAHDLIVYRGIQGEINFESYHSKKCAECDIKTASPFNKCTRLDNPCFTRNGIYCTNKTQCHR